MSLPISIWFVRSSCVTSVFIRYCLVKLQSGITLEILTLQNLFCYQTCMVFPFLLRWKNVLSSSHALHFRFIRYKSVNFKLLSVTCPVLVQSLCGFYAPHYDHGSRRIDEFCHRITKFCIFLSVFPPLCIRESV